MKTLALLRHGKSSWDDPDVRDFDRPLKRRGKDASKLMGAEMRRRGLQFDLVLASPARRIVETIVHLDEGYGDRLQPRLEENIYDASSGRLLKILRQIGDDTERVLLIGHNPGLQDLAVTLIDEDDALSRSVADSYPTAALALIELSAERWADVEPGTGRITAFLKPRDLTD